MRTYGRVYNELGVAKWVEVSTDPNGYNDWVYVTTLCQVIKGSPGESPFYANYGIPGQQSVMQQIAPDYYSALTQQQFAQYFASLSIRRVAGAAEPTYTVAVTTHQGIALEIGVPT